MSDGYVFWSSTKLIYRVLFSREKNNNKRRKPTIKVKSKSSLKKDCVGEYEM